LIRPRFEAPMAGGTLMSIEADRRWFETLILELLSHRLPDTTMCPLEVAKAASPDTWRMLMPAVRSASSRLAATQAIDILQGGRVLRPDSTWRGPIRLRRGAAWLQHVALRLPRTDGPREFGPVSGIEQLS
jgi:hypothetical protein